MGMGASAGGGVRGRGRRPRRWLLALAAATAARSFFAGGGSCCAAALAPVLEDLRLADPPPAAAVYNETLAHTLVQLCGAFSVCVGVGCRRALVGCYAPPRLRLLLMLHRPHAKTHGTAHTQAAPTAASPARAARRGPAGPASSSRGWTKSSKCTRGATTRTAS